MAENTVSESRSMRAGTGTPIINPRINGRFGLNDRMASLLADRDWNPTRDQVADLLGRAFRSGQESADDDVYERGVRDERARQTELNLAAVHAAIDTPAFSAAALAETARKQAHRARWDAWARVPHRRDHTGGAVAPW
jgi:hypothetical protein